jgi:hypothetical protein
VTGSSTWLGRSGDYRGQDVAGIVLAGGSLTVHRLAVEERGAAGAELLPQSAHGLVGDDPDLVRWGHLDPANTRTPSRSERAPQARRSRPARLREDHSIAGGGEARLVPDHFGCDRCYPRNRLRTRIVHLSPRPPEPGRERRRERRRGHPPKQRELCPSGEERSAPPPRRTLRFVWPPGSREASPTS